MTDQQQDPYEAAATAAVKLALWGIVVLLLLAAPIGFFGRLVLIIFRWSWGLLAVALLAGALAAGATPASASCSSSCIARSRTHYELRVIKPYRPWLRSTGACESGAGRSLRAGLRAYNPAGPWLGRYQLGYPAWSKAGGRGDPRDAGWLEQAYRAVRWRAIIARAGVGPHSSMGWPVCG